MLLCRKKVMKVKMTGLVRNLEESQISQFKFPNDLFKNSDQSSKSYLKIYIGTSTSVVN